MAPFGQNHGVGVMSQAHFLNMVSFSETQLNDTLNACKQYFLEATQLQGSSVVYKYPVLVWNYLPPSAGSIIHPHVQFLLEDAPLPMLKKFQKKTAKYALAKSSNYYVDLIAKEKSGKRFVATVGSVEVLTSFAPRGMNEVQFIIPGVASFTDLDEKQIGDFSTALVKVLKGYFALGLGSFNLVSYSLAVGEKSKDYCLHFKLFSRPNPTGIYTNDTGPMERVYDSFVIDSIPENLAESLREAFK